MQVRFLGFARTDRPLRANSRFGMGRPKQSSRHVLLGAVLLLVMAVEVVTSLSFPHGKDRDLRVGHYALTCPNVERIVRLALERGVQQDRSIVAGVLRLHFRDCFVEVRRCIPHPHDQY